MAYKKKSRRSYGSGSVSVNNKIKRYTVIWTDEQGRKHSKSTFPLSPVGKRDAERFLAEINQAKSAGITVGETASLEAWIRDKIDSERGRVRDSTTTSREAALNRIKRYYPELLETPINEVSEGMVGLLYRNMEKSGLKPATIKRVHILLHSTFKRAKARRVLLNNVVENVNTLSIKKREIEVFSWRESGRIFRFLKQQPKHSNRMSHDWYLVFRLLHSTGMRVGELLALQWSDIDIKNRAIHVHATISNGNKTIEAPKTAAGNRLIPILSDKLLYLLKKASTTDKIYVVETEKGNRMPYPMLLREWSTVRAATGINKTLHCFRHTWATIMLKRGFPLIEISRILGHSSPRITLEVYSHAIPSYNDRMIEDYKRMMSAKS